MSNLVKLKPLAIEPGLTDQVYRALKHAISKMDIYSDALPPKLDERQLAEELGVSRTPIREAIMQLEKEGLVKSEPRRGAFVVRKTKKEMIEIIKVLAALEGMAARLAVEVSSDHEIASLRRLLADFDSGNKAKSQIGAYAETNIKFHQKLIELSRCDLLIEHADMLFVHMRAIRRKTIGERDRAAESVVDHKRIIDALESRDAGRSERLVREHAMYLAAHVERYVTYLN